MSRGWGWSEAYFAKVMGELYDPSYGVSYGNPVYVEVPDLLGNGTETIGTIPVLDNNGISSYYLNSSDPIYKIQMNTGTDNDFIYIYGVSKH